LVSNGSGAFSSSCSGIGEVVSSLEQLANKTKKKGSHAHWESLISESSVVRQ
jgi:hypothetical protein